MTNDDGSLEVITSPNDYMPVKEALEKAGLTPEFAQITMRAAHKTISKQLDASFYFAHPYASWGRGTNENTNGLIRQYFPKYRDFTTITQRELNMAMEKLNNQPRKRLDYQTPSQVFFKSTVALHT